MATYDMGGFIRQLRHERGVTQEQLCNGLCSVSTLSKIERGQYTPPGYLFRILMERLGNYFGRHYITLQNKHDFEMWKKMEEINNAVTQFELEKANALLSEYCLIEGVNEGFGRQFILNSKVSIAIQQVERAKSKFGKYDSDCEINTNYDEWVEMMLESIRITIPEFDETKVSTYMLSYEEIKAIVCLNASYFYKKDYEKVIQVLGAVIESMDKYCPDMREKSRYHAVILANIAESLYEAKRYDDAIRECVRGWKYCVEYSRTMELALFMSLHGKSLVGKGEMEKGRALLRQTYCIAIGNGAKAVAKEVQSFFSKAFGEELEVCHMYPFCMCDE